MEEIKEGYIRVSDLLDVWTDFKHIDPHVLENKARIGTNVHEKISAELNGYFIDLAPDEEGYFESWLRWYEKNDKTPYLEWERRFYSDEFLVTGQVDAIKEREDGTIQIIDYKTSASPSLERWGFQAGWYYLLAKENGYDVEPEVTILNLKKDGKAAKEYKIQCDKALLHVCVSALYPYRYFKCRQK